MKPLLLVLSLLVISISQSRAQTPLTWQVVYNGDFDSQRADLTILDLFEFTSSQALGEVRPIAYFSAHYEDWRPDAHLFGRKLNSIPGWDGEQYIDWTDQRNQAVMLGRLRLAKEKGFLGVDIDNIDGPGTVPYFSWLLREAKAMGLKVGLKNAVETLPKFGHQVDFFVSEASSLSELTCYKKYRKPVVRMYYNSGANTPSFIREVVNGRNGNRF